MLRPIHTPLLVVFSLSSCDQILKTEKTENNESIAEKIQISSPSKPEVIAAFQAIAKATFEHNQVYLQYFDKGIPANEVAYSAGIADLDRSARAHGGLSKQIIDAVAVTCIYEKGLFTPFDTIDKQLAGMAGWSSNGALQVRGYIQIIDQTIDTYDKAVTYLQGGEEALQQWNFDKKGVPKDVSAEFFRLSRETGKVISESKLGIFQEQRSALKSYRDAFTSADQATADSHIAKARQHEQRAKQFEGEMISEIRKRMSSSGML